jgi:SAM-dependent methyltransferase
MRPSASKVRSRQGPQRASSTSAAGWEGCPVGLLSRFGALENYTGIDVALPCIAWCQRFVAQPGVEFVHLDLANERYNPRGAPIDADFGLPLPDAGFDVIYAYSVFSHMRPGDVRAYLREFTRLLAPGGGVYLSAFVEPNVEDVAINPPGYGRFPGAWEGPLHCVRFDRGFFEGLAREAGLVIERLDHSTETDGQSGVYLGRAPQYGSRSGQLAGR